MREIGKKCWKFTCSAVVALRDDVAALEQHALLQVLVERVGGVLWK